MATPTYPSGTHPIILATWSFGRTANAAGWPVLAAGGSSLDAVEKACRSVESDPAVDSVGLGGLPDAQGDVSLDGCIMRSPRECGAVSAVREFNHPVSIARKVMERTPHIMLSGAGAEGFAESMGFARTTLLTDEAREQWLRWTRDDRRLREDPRFRGWLPPSNIEELRGYEPTPETVNPRSGGDQPPQVSRHEVHDRPSDTVGVLSIDARGELAGACSTSGMAFKIPGRVGDSPIIGHGLYVEPGVGAAVGTGNGELIMSVCGAFLAVEELRRGASPHAAALAVIERICRVHDIVDDHQAVMLVLRSDGHWAAAALRPGYRTAVCTAESGESLMVPATSILFPEIKGDRLPAAGDLPSL